MKVRLSGKSGLSKRLQGSRKRYVKELIKSHRSVVLNRKVIVEILLPSNARKSGRRYPLLILNDGQDNKAVKIKTCVEQLVEQGEIPEIIIVGVYAHNRMHEYGIAGKPDYKRRGDRADKYAAFIVKELVPYLKGQFPIDDGPHAIAGYSLGALSALDIAWHHADIFNRVGVFSGALWWRSKDAADKRFNEQKHRMMHQLIRKSRHKPALKFWFQTGTKDEFNDRNQNSVIDSIDDTVDLMDELVKKAYKPFDDINYLEVIDGEHNQKTWARVMPYFLMWAFGDI